MIRYLVCHRRLPARTIDGLTHSAYYTHSVVIPPLSCTRSDMFFLFFSFPLPIHQGHTLLARHSGADVSLLHSLLAQHSGSTSTNTAPLATSTAVPKAPAASHQRTEEEINARCRELMNKHKVMLFMKGNPTAPKCGFSRQTVGLLREKGVEFAWFDIFSDEDVRQGLKKLNDWPSEWLSSDQPLRWRLIGCLAFPQIILKGELVGGLDIFREMVDTGEWDEIYHAEDVENGGEEVKA